MQLATSRNNQPWVCTVYFVALGGKFYWLSYPERRHSEEATDNPHAAIAIAVKQDLPVIGIQAEGDVSVITNIAEATKVLALYVKKYGAGKKFVELLKRGSNHHQLYCFTPRRVVLFDETQTTQKPYREIVLDD